MNSLLTLRVEGQPQLEQKLHALDEALDTRRILDEGAALLYNRTRTRFLQEMDPTGHHWVPSKAAERRSRTGRGGGILYATGKLFRSLQLFADSDDTRAIGTNVTSAKGFPYGMAHQFGWGLLPVRMFIGFGIEDIGLMSQLILRRIVEAVK